MRCENHPDLIATETCAKCSRDFCPDCVVAVRERTYCKRCVGRALEDERVQAGGGGGGGDLRFEPVAEAPGAARGGPHPYAGGGASPWPPPQAGAQWPAPPKPSRAGRNIMLACGCLVVFCLGSGVLAAVLMNKYRPQIVRDSCQGNLQEIRTALDSWRATHGGAVPWTSAADGARALQELLPAGHDEKMNDALVCPAAFWQGGFAFKLEAFDHPSYAVAEPPTGGFAPVPLERPETAAPRDKAGAPVPVAGPSRPRPLVFDKTPVHHDGTRLVLFDDGSVRQLPEADFERLQKGEAVTLPDPLAPVNVSSRKSRDDD